MRPWPLLLVAASSDARCGCDRRVIVATTVNGVRTASLLVPSAARVGAALVVYHEDSADAAAGLEPTEPRARRDAPACFVEAAGCYAAHDLHVLYPWLAAFADALGKCSFTNGADKETVIELYRKTATWVLGSTRQLKYLQLEWTVDDFKHLVEALSYCGALQELMLVKMGVGDADAAAIVAGLASCPSLPARSDESTP